MRIRSSDPSTALGPPDSDGPLSVRPAPETIPPASSVRSSTIAASIPTLHRANALLETRRRGETALGVTDEQNATLTSIAQWSKDYLTRPHPMLGRTGHVCPWVDASMRTGCYYITLLETNDEDEIERVFLRLQAYFLKMEPRDARDAQLKTIVVVFPTIDDVAAPSFITRVHARLKPYFVAKGLMLGEFFASCQKEGLRNRGFRPLSSPLPLIAIRSMVATDVAFLSDSMTFMAAYLKTFAKAGVDQCFDYLEENRADIESHRVATIVDALRASGVDAHRTAPEKDSFSGLYTIDYLLNRASNAIRQRLDPSLVVFELDEFEALQETLGVGAAAFALWEVARLVRPALRRDAVFARHGYDQRFVILIPNGNEESVDTLSERLRKLVSTSVCVYNGQKLSLSIRVGTSESGRLRKKSAIALLAAAADSLDGGAAEAESSVPDARPSSAPPTKPPPSFARPK